MNSSGNMNRKDWYKARSESRCNRQLLLIEAHLERANKLLRKWLKGHADGCACPRCNDALADEWNDLIVAQGMLNAALSEIGNAAITPWAEMEADAEMEQYRDDSEEQGDAA